VSNSFVFSKILVLYSITNSDSTPESYLDFNSPFSLFDYLKYTQNNVNANELEDSYSNYIEEWNKAKKIKDVKVLDTIQERYFELIKDITVNYTTSDEKRFLANIDFDDPTEVDILLPFFSNKVIEICDFYNKKREKLKYKIDKNKNKGTFNSIEKSIYETITDVIFSDVLNVGVYQPSVNYKTLLKKLDIEIEELYDLYTNYLDNDPDETYKKYDVKTKLRQDLYTANINFIDANIFLNISKAVKNQLLENVRIFLTEFGRLFTINYDTDTINLDCKPNEALYDLITNNRPKAERLVKLKESLIKKYIGSDFYYIQTGSTITDVTSAILFKADNPSGNLLNRHFPTTASVEEESDVQSCRRIGLFFTPEKNSILYYSVPEKRYKLDYKKLQPNKLYIFPDPDKYGNTTGLKRTFDSKYPLIHICDYTKSVKNLDQGLSEGDINSTAYTQDFYAYFSKNQIVDSIYTGKEGLKTNFSSMYNMGVVTKWSSDIFGNQFALFKDKSRRNIIDNSFFISNSSLVCEEYDGGPIKFFEEANDYLPEVVYTTHPDWVKPNIWSSYYYYNISIDGGVGGIRNGIMVRPLYEFPTRIDGMMINYIKRQSVVFDVNINPLIFKDLLLIDGNFYNLLDDTIDRSKIFYNWDINILHETINDRISYTIDGLRYTRNPSNISDSLSSTLDGNAEDNVSKDKPSFNNGYILSSIKYKDFDAGLITEICEMDFDFEDQTKFIINQTLASSKTLSSDHVQQDNKNSYELRNTLGRIYVRDIVSGNITPLISALSIILVNKYNQTVLEEIDRKVLDFNIYNNFLWIRTENYNIVEILNYEQDKFVYSETIANHTQYDSTGVLNNISNPFIFENREYAMMVQLSAVNTISNNFGVVPFIYKIDYTKATKTKIYPHENSDFTLFYNNSSLNQIKLNRINPPVLTFNTRNQKYAVVSTLEDQNGLAYILQMKFWYDGVDISSFDVKLYNFINNEYIKTINFYDTPSLTQNNITFNNITLNNTASFDSDVLTFS
jgi:hypothetical protein